ncbi:MAG: 4Fe-4S binding protein [Proteobacteria bacterium]|nr:4Fe-4S binding protein [Pseudomonadota bacterium]
MSTYSATDTSSLACGDCDTCVKACPVGALAVKESS